MQLTGRESLVQLIGKRRRFLPNRHSLLSSPIQSNLNLRDRDDDAVSTPSAGAQGSSEQNSNDDVKMGASDWVACPVCGKKVRGDNYMINSHLDTCLARGSKRKLRQHTLLQLNFCSRSKANSYDAESDTAVSNGFQSDCENRAMCDSIQEMNGLVGSEECNNDQFEDLINSDVGKKQRVGSTKEAASDDRINCGVNPSLLLLEDDMPKYVMVKSMDDICEVHLETFIVGRRFVDEVELDSGARILLSRDPDNANDPNAVKVLSADGECTEVLGFLPRELARYLSPLMEKFCLRFEGYVKSLPQRSRAVPVRIFCQRKGLNSENQFGDLQVFNSMWKHVLRVVESAKAHPFSMTKHQENFILLLQEVLRSYSYLFTLDEKSFLETFLSLSVDSQRLFVHLYTRKGPWFRMSNISYPEIFDCERALKELSATGYVSTIESLKELQIDDLKEVLNVLTVGELREILLTIYKKCNHGRRKQDLIASLLSSYKDGLCPDIVSAILAKTGPCIQLSLMAKSLIWRAERLFFLNGEQDLLAFLLVDLGIVKYPSYKCIISDKIFLSHDDLLSYEEAIEVAQVMDESLDENNSELIIRCIEISDYRMCSSVKENRSSSTSEAVNAFLSFFSAPWVYSKVVLLGISFFEHMKRYPDAINLLRRLLNTFTSDGRRGYWTLRLSIDLEHLNRPDESLSVAEYGLLDPWVRAGSRVALQRRVLRLGKPPRRWKIPCYAESVKRKINEVHIVGRPLSCETGIKNRFYGENGEQCSVEQLALQFYAGEGGGWQGAHTESGIWLTIFGLLMWDIIFADVPNVFLTRFQTAPLDMETDNFYEVRKSSIESLLEKIQDGMAEEILITSWELYVGTACRGVNWDRHSLSELRAAVTCIGGPCLALICRHLAQDYRSWSSGMPDLVLWRFNGDYGGEAKLVEVKGPRDRLSEQQRAWLLFLMDCGFNTEVCRVNPPIST